MALTFHELRLVADLYYSRLPCPSKEKAKEFIDSLDVMQNGKITMEALKSSNATRKFGVDFLERAFYGLDEGGKGYLNSDDCLTLYYICTYSMRSCDGCQKTIPQGFGYTCLKCWKEGITTTNLQIPSLCLQCYSQKNYQHIHGTRQFFHDFAMFEHIIKERPWTVPPEETLPAPFKEAQQTTRQCKVCGDYHESTARGFKSDVHMAPVRNSTELVCEWCFSYLCLRCGKLFRDSSLRAEPGKWLKKFVCHDCTKSNSSQDIYYSSVQAIQRALSRSELLQHCSTCKIKQQNGTLFWVVDQKYRTQPAGSS
ncbi:hypothetical protein KP509_25G012800 [Ceratopteris richardii]|uniref:EF-hand domain-containing protein n=1 Tax=Ceratopteris richardii TaxID=49495 RepID=A0A8T2RNY2_CERRI|nr:hypothetical protein KP509_25G012800 [Ceratopteris richardii]